MGMDVRATDLRDFNFTRNEYLSDFLVGKVKGKWSVVYTPAGLVLRPKENEHILIKGWELARVSRLALAAQLARFAYQYKHFFGDKNPITATEVAQHVANLSTFRNPVRESEFAWRVDHGTTDYTCYVAYGSDDHFTANGVYHLKLPSNWAAPLAVSGDIEDVESWSCFSWDEMGV